MCSEKISVIISVKNESEKIERCLEAVFNQTIKPFEIIMVDWHLTDKTVEKAKKYVDPVIIIDDGSLTAQQRRSKQPGL